MAREESEKLLVVVWYGCWRIAFWPGEVDVTGKLRDNSTYHY